MFTNTSASVPKLFVISLLASTSACSGGSGFTTGSGQDASTGGTTDDGGNGPIIVVNPSGPDASVDGEAGAPQNQAPQVDAAPDATDATVVCPASELACSGGCVSNDVHNCGSCGTVCSAPANGSVSCAFGGDAAYGCVVSCASGYTSCGGACANVQSDPKNCGACGHDCKAGTCAGGACQAWVVATGMVDPNANNLVGNQNQFGLNPSVATDGKTVAWIDANVSDVPAGAGGSATVHAPASDAMSNSYPAAIAGGVISWVHFDTDPTSQNPPGAFHLMTAKPGVLGEVVAATLPNGTNADREDVVAGFAMNPAGTVAYIHRQPYTSGNGTYDGFQGAVWACNIEASPATCSNTFTTRQGDSDIAATADSVFFADTPGSQVVRYELSSKQFSIFVVDPGAPYLLALDAQYVYWASKDNVDGGIPTVSIRRSLLSSGSAVETVVSSFSGYVDHIATDGTNLYFSATTIAGGAVEYAPANGGSGGATPMAPISLYSTDDGSRLTSVVTGGGAIFWYNTDNDKVWGLSAP